MADYVHAECLAVYVQQGGFSNSAHGTEQEAANRHLNFARSLHIETRVVEKADPAEALVNSPRRTPCFGHADYYRGNLASSWLLSGLNRPPRSGKITSVTPGG